MTVIRITIHRQTAPYGTWYLRTGFGSFLAADRVPIYFGVWRTLN